MGEAAQAVIGATGQDPREGATRSGQDVEAELRDVIMTATVALRALAPGAAAVLARPVRGVAACPHAPRSPRPGQESRGMAGRQRVAE
ncbi:hypothetical protein GCM10010433_20750 [Streptomyces pulveraceus]|uniref:Uncharacterized protein n=1 Tax=Streptomyces pulveraceus TaxID=68258 RepID=A0ABW1GQ80_9ACTN